MPVRLQGFTCVNCRYNLSGNSLGDRCPECGWDVSTSLYGMRFYAKTYAIFTIVATLVSILFAVVPLVGLLFVSRAWKFYRECADSARDERVQSSLRWRNWALVAVTIATLAGITNVAATIVAATWAIKLMR
jgi:hypothetical protein